MKISASAVLLVFLYANLLSAAETLDFIPRHSSQVLQISLTDISRMETTRNDMIRSFLRQTGLEKGRNGSEKLISSIDKIVIVTPVLTKAETFVFIKTKGKGSELLRRLNEETGLRQISVKNGNLTEYWITLRETGMIPGVAPRKRTFVFTFLADNVAVIAKDSLAGYWKYKNRGLPERKRKYLKVPQALAAGFIETDPEFLRENPFFPPLQEAVYSLAAGPAGSLRIQVRAGCPDEKTANQTQMLMQQYIMIGGMLLNQTGPELMQEWMDTIKVSRTGSAVFLSGVFSRNFLDRLTAASEKLAENRQLPGRPENKR